jgi:hypothetical protein
MRIQNGPSNSLLVVQVNRERQAARLNGAFDPNPKCLIGAETNVPSIAPGKYLPASTTAFYLVATDHVWVDANPKETELTDERPGQPVKVTVDTYPDLEWRGNNENRD